MESTTRPDVSSDPYLNYTAAGRRRLAEAQSPITLLRNGDLEEALKAAVLGAFDGNDDVEIVDGTEDPLHVAVWSAEPDPLFTDLYPEVVPSVGVTGEFGTTHRHNVRACVFCWGLVLWLWVDVRLIPPPAHAPLIHAAHPPHTPAK